MEMCIFFYIYNLTLMESRIGSSCLLCHSSCNTMQNSDCVQSVGYELNILGGPFTFWPIQVVCFQVRKKPMIAFSGYPVLREWHASNDN